MKRPIATLVFMVLISIFLSSCITIDDVSQPTNGTLGEPFTVTVNTRNTAFTGDWGIPVFAVNLPDTWEIVSCTAVFDFGTYDCTTPDPNHDWFVNNRHPGNWQSRQLLPIRYYPPGSTGEVTWTIRPTTTGDFFLDYWASAFQPLQNTYRTSVNNDNEYAFDHPITISRATPIPTLNDYSMVILAGLLVLSSVFFLKSKKDTKMKTPFAVILMIIGITAILLYQSTETIAQDTGSATPVTPTMNNLKILAATGDNQAILNDINWSSEEKAWLEQLSDEDLQAALQVFNESENPKNIRCMVITDPPQLKCKDCTNLVEE
jgi:hypothetical protein